MNEREESVQRGPVKLTGELKMDCQNESYKNGGA